MVFPIATMLSGPDLLVVAVVVLVLFGGAKVGGFMRSLGEGVKEFKKATNEDDPATGPTASTQAAGTDATGANKEETSRL